MKQTLAEKISDRTGTETRQLMWKGDLIPEYTIRNDGTLFHNDNMCASWLRNGRNYSIVIIQGHNWEYRHDYMVAYTFLGMKDDAIRLIHINDDIADDHINNLMWYRKVDVLNEYKELAIIESDGSIIEEWRPIKLEYNPNIHYEVNNFGMVRDAKTRELVSLKESHGYRVFYYLDANYAKQTRIKSVHRAVAEAFLPNPNGYELVNHLDGDGFNDAVYNLEWATSGMNMEHAYLQQLNTKSKYSVAQIKAVCELLSYNKISHVEMSYMTGVDRKTISDVFRGRRWKELSCKYNFQIKKWNDSMKEEVCRLILTGMKGKEIFTQLNMPYDQSNISFYERMRRELKTAGKVA